MDVSTLGTLGLTDLPVKPRQCFWKSKCIITPVGILFDLEAQRRYRAKAEYTQLFGRKCRSQRKTEGKLHLVTRKLFRSNLLAQRKNMDRIVYPGRVLTHIIVIWSVLEEADGDTSSHSLV